MNTHARCDHTFGNSHFGPGSTLDLPIHGHHLLPAHLDDHERPRLAAWRDGSGDEPARDWGGVVINPGPPMYGSGCFPLEWPATLAAPAAEIGPGDVIVPGHGPPVTRDFVVGQVAHLAALAARLRALHAAGATVEEALAADGAARR